MDSSVSKKRATYACYLMYIPLELLVEDLSNQIRAIMWFLSWKKLMLNLIPLWICNEVDKKIWPAML